MSRTRDVEVIDISELLNTPVEDILKELYNTVEPDLFLDIIDELPKGDEDA